MVIWIRRLKACSLAVLVMVGAAACTMTLPDTSQPEVGLAPAVRPAGPGMTLGDFERVVGRVEPVAERYCRERAPGENCDFKIIVDQRAGQKANAFQSVDKNGRPQITFTLALIQEAQNRDEIAFILGHEAAHHIKGHLSRGSESALAGAVLAGVLASLAGADAGMIDAAWDIGGAVGGRTFSKDYELEADRLGTVIAYRAGYDPLRGAGYFDRIADPGNQFLGTHPPNAERKKTVRKTLERLQ